MTDRETTEILEDTDADGTTPEGMRATIDRLSKKVDKYETDEKARALDDSGLDGPALKAVTKDLKRGEYEGEFTAEALREYAQEEYDWSPSEVTDTEDPPQVDEATQQRLDAQQTRDDLNASSHARGDTEEGPEATQAEIDRKMDEGDVQGAVLTEIQSKVARAQ
jgi:hypothetical protein